MGRNADALAQLRIAAALMPSDSAPHYQLGALYRRIGQLAKADAEYQIVRNLKAQSNENDGKQLAR